MNTNETPMVAPVDNNLNVPVASPAAPSVASVAENSSGMGQVSVVPAELDGFNWGAFLMTWIWGLGNSSVKAFLLGFFINIFPITGIIVGMKGNKWAWQNKKWASIAEFKNTQKNWAIVGLVLNFIAVPLMIFGSVAIMATINPAAQIKKAEMMKQNTQIENTLPILEEQ